MHHINAQPNWNINKDSIVRYLSMRSGYENHVLGVAKEYVEKHHPGYYVAHVGDLMMTGVRVRPNAFGGGVKQQNEPKPKVRVYVGREDSWENHLEVLEIPIEAFMTKAGFDSHVGY